MADEQPSTSPWEPVVLILGIIIVLLALIWARGGLNNINTEGFFVAPPVPSQNAAQGGPSANTSGSNTIPSQ